MRRIGYEVLGVVALGGALGSVARYALTLVLPKAASGTLPWSTFLANVTGCALIGALMVIIESGAGHRLLRPFFGVGVLGGYTTLSTYVVDTITLVRLGHTTTALFYALLTVLSCLLAVLTGAWAMRAIRR